MNLTSRLLKRPAAWFIALFCVLLVSFCYGEFSATVRRAQAFVPPAPKKGFRDVADIVKVPVPGLKVYVLYTGDIQVGGKAMLDPKNPKVRPDEIKKQYVPAMAYLVRHPIEGDILFDTGFGPAFVGSTNGDLGWWTRPLVRTNVHKGQDLSSQLSTLGIDPSSLKYVVLSHGHVDHTAGLPALGPVTVLVGRGERSAIARPFSLIHGYKQSHFAKIGHLLEVNFDQAPEIAPLGHMIDLFGDGAVYLVDSRGHTPGHLSMLVNLPNGPLILTGDSVQTHRAFTDAVPSGNSSNLKAASEAAERLLALGRQTPKLRLFYGHDPHDAANALRPPGFYQ
jgi:glyoxylase-like metal-dependent hydrolase (beta-lactamase superfamily II)